MDTTPFIGQIVHYWPHYHEDDKPRAALIIDVADQKTIAIQAFMHNGTITYRSAVRLCQESDTTSVLEEHCRFIAEAPTVSAPPPAQDPVPPGPFASGHAADEAQKRAQPPGFSFKGGKPAA